MRAPSHGEADRPVRVVVACVDATILVGMTNALRQAGYPVELCSDRTTALQRIAVSRPDVVILDLALDGVSIEDVRRERAASASRQLIVLTAPGDLLDRIRALDAGADDILTRPFYTRELTHHIGRHVRTRRSAEEPRRVRPAPHTWA